MQNYKDYQVDLTNCDKEPIHIIGRIQPHGFLLILNKETLLIEQVSQNISDFSPDHSPEELIDKPLQVLLSAHEEAFNPELLLQPDHSGPIIISVADSKFFGFSHLSEGKIVLECERYTSYLDREKIKHNTILSRLHEHLNTIESVEELGEAAAETVMDMLDYDQVYIMRFDTDWHTEVIAECRKEGMTSYLGHHFPATDIPEPARALLLEKKVRQIPNVGAQAVEIIPYVNPSTGAPSNILRSELRNPSEIHLEYLRNMGVAASMSFSIVVRGKLWGVLACQHKKPVFIEVWRRQLCQLITQTLADSIAALQEKRDMKQYNVFKRNEQAFISHLMQYEDLVSALSQATLDPLTFTEATGVALVLNKQVFTFGTTPSSSELSKLAKWLEERMDEKVYSTQQLSKQFSEAEAYRETASGLLALEISRYNQEYLLFFKPEIKKKRIWAGNPDKSVLEEGMRLHPRKSFENWEQVVKGNSLPWSINEIEIGQLLAKDLTALRLTDQAAKLKDLNAQLETTAKLLSFKNSQLQDFALIMSHNLRSPLNNIEGLHELYRLNPSEANAAFAMDQVAEVAGNMSRTISDLNLILNIDLQAQLPSEEVELESIIQKEIQNMGVAVEKTEAHFETELQVPTLTLPLIYLESILHNLVSNALKYYSPDRKPVIRIRSWQENDRVCLSVSDNGLGMDLEKVGHKVFGLYKTFHEHEQAKGLGLYLTKIQTESLGGQISVKSEVGKGTTFTVTFPHGA
ncbi:ATP-binding protein [Pontibacter harenae]|uniref:ATP-binding protein n=1 Tax=Pontibacter harenae TaxID=2894083 RepID=UPI001E5B7757|nr:ATP-binding protein [Pontibacter harenae]MCC9167873.1 GAF domain-containing protein [Pontibacter harenae]